MKRTVAEMTARLLYVVLGMGMIPVLAAYLVRRGLRQPEYLRHWPERFLGLNFSSLGHHAFGGAHTKRVLWVHAVSVGETRAAAPLVQYWLGKGEQYAVVLTHTTPTGRETGQLLFAKWLDPLAPRIVQRYLPYDFLWANWFFLTWARPVLGVLMETELWPNLLAQAKTAHIPMALINARLSRRSAVRLARFRWLSQPAIECLSGIAAQSEADAKGFSKVAVVPRLAVTGNMKFDVTPPQEMIALGNAWRSRIGQRQIWLAASTREDEEIALLKAWAGAHARGEIGDGLLVVVPRHPQRFDRVAGLIASEGIDHVRRSVLLNDPQASLSPTTHVMLGDSLGEMFAYLQMADLVLVGGSIPALGGQNPIEACALGKPVFFGPNMFNFRAIARALVASGAGHRVASHADWLAQGVELLRSPARYETQSGLALEFSLAHRGATERTTAFLESILQTAR